ncbi:hypothetical protein [Clostridium weizhouense]|uniref:Uncharacterized protein n=1 Tax=Clostridium weizhouense TaxID=2859781 RepID=A0ABS7AL26_9CLOT|nr:hypothetical protein [Clostridium weizhouense]MBW6409264.1 hypothetical protein [Clostridium weizhouense]
MIQVDIEFIHKVLDSNIQIQELVDMNIEIANLRYNYINNRKNIIIMAKVIFDIEYIPIDKMEIRNLEIKKLLNKFINLDKSVLHKNNYDKNFEIVNKKIKLIEENTIFANASIDLMIS